MMTLAVNAVSVATETTLLTPAIGNRILIHGWSFASSIAGNVLLRNGTGGPVLIVLPLLIAGGGSSASFESNTILCDTDAPLTADGPLLSSLSGTLFYDEVSY